MNVQEYNRRSWNKLVDKGNVWTRPVTEAAVAAARKGEWAIVLSPTKPVPRDWFPADLADRDVLCLACGGGQQGPILAAAGARVTVLDNSPKQLQQDETVARRDGLNITTQLGDMRDLSTFADCSFDIVVHQAGAFVDSIRPVWMEAARVLRPGGALLSGHSNPIAYIFDLKAWNQGQLKVRHSIPYSDVEDLSQEELHALVLDHDDPVCFGHSLHDLIQGQVDAGFAIAGFYEDKEGGGPLDPYIDSFIVTKAVKIEISSLQHGGKT